MSESVEKKSGYLTWNTCTEEQRLIIENRLGYVVANNIARTKCGTYALFKAIRYNAFSSLYHQYTPQHGFRNGPMTIEHVNSLILKLFDDIDFGNMEFQYKD